MDILTVAPPPERTFWEKAMILHHEANRPEHLEMPQRYSRHYCDLYHMAMTPVKEVAFSRPDLLKKSRGFQDEILSQRMGKVPGGCAGNIEVDSAGIPVGGVRDGL